VSDSETKASPYKVQVIDRAVGIIDALAGDRPDRGLTEIAEELHLHKSTVHRLLMILERHRMVEREPHTGRYRLGLRLFELGSLAIARFSIRERARHHLERLVADVDETVHLCVLDSGEVLYVDKIEPSRSVRMASRIGRRNGAHSSAVGKAIQAHLSESDVDDLLRKLGQGRFTARTIVTPADLKAELKAARKRGYAIDNEEGEEGVRCVGAAVLGHNGLPLAAISVSAPTFRLPMEKIPSVAAAVCAAARQLSAESGYGEAGGVSTALAGRGKSGPARRAV
jgi:DNA-binding IclR family transcriptional regulator